MIAGAAARYHDSVSVWEQKMPQLVPSAANRPESNAFQSQKDVHSFTTHQHANGHTKHKTFTPRTHHTRFIQMLADM